MQPTLWGPPLWQTLLAMAYHCPLKNLVHFHRMVDVQLASILPCKKCRDHMSRPKMRKHIHPLACPEDAVTMIWNMHNEVNKSLGRKSVEEEDVLQRLEYHGGLLDDVALGDALVMMAIDANTRHVDDIFIQFCATLKLLLPLPEDSTFLMRVAPAGRPIVAHAVRAVRAARAERGLPEYPATHYKRLAV